jgi:tRNA(Ile)-lysidine synthase
MNRDLIPMGHRVLSSTDSRVRTWIDRHRMLAGVRRLGVAVSGGSDSVAMLRLVVPVCVERGIVPVVLHLDHGLRGAASAGDARFVARLAKRLGLSFRMQTAGPAGQRAHSLEMGARAARQAFFRQVAREERLDAIATGHTVDDVAETLLLRLFRGGGATGLSGLRPVHRVHQVRYVRPVLDCTHAFLRDWLTGLRQSWREDESNRNTKIPRNRIRHRILPWLARNGAPGVSALLAQSASILRDEDALLDRLALAALAGVAARPAKRARNRLSPPVLRRAALAANPVALQRRVLRIWLLDAGLADAAGYGAIEGLVLRLRDSGPWQVSVPGGMRVRCRNGRIELAPTERLRDQRTNDGGETAAVALAIPGHVVVAGVRVTAQRGRGIVPTTGPVGAIPSGCSLDAETLRGRTLVVRTRLPGDRIRPVGMQGSRKLQDLLVDAKVPAEDRAHLPVLVVGDEVVWVPGYRVAQAFAVRMPGAATVWVRMEKV